MRKSLTHAVLISMMAASAQAATLSNLEGAVFVNDGSGFHRVSAGTSLAPGARVRTEKGSVVIAYENGCTTRLAPNQSAVVLSTPPTCGGGLKDGPAAPCCGTDWFAVAGIVALGTGVAIGIAEGGGPASP
jgi:hypothetical protein